MAGETTSALSSKVPYEGTGDGMFLVPFSVAYLSTDNQASDVMELGYLPANCTVYGFYYAPTDMDTNVSPAVVHKVTIGSTDVATGLTGAQTGTASVVAITPLALTAKTLAKVTTTTAAATGAAGTLPIAFVCQK
jgi:hypothetical protein